MGLAWIPHDHIFNRSSIWTEAADGDKLKSVSPSPKCNFKICLLASFSPLQDDHQPPHHPPFHDFLYNSAQQGPEERFIIVSCPSPSWQELTSEWGAWKGFPLLYKASSWKSMKPKIWSGCIFLWNIKMVCLIAHMPIARYFGEDGLAFSLRRILLGLDPMKLTSSLANATTRKESWRRTTSLKRALGSLPRSDPWLPHHEKSPSLLGANGETRGSQGWWGGRRGGGWRRAACTTSPSSSSLKFRLSYFPNSSWLGATWD